MNRSLSEDELFLEVTNSMQRVFRVSGDKIQPATTLIADLGAESIDFLDLSCELEKLVDTEIDFRRLFDAKRTTGQNTALDLTVQELIDFLKSELESTISEHATPATQPVSPMGA